MAALADTNPGLVNRRVPSKGEAAVARMLGGEDPSSKLARRTVFTKSTTEPGSSGQKKEKREKGVSIRSRAQLIAEKIRSDGSRVPGAKRCLIAASIVPID